ncbi:MAG: DUF4271 domain-containing protein [Bacteroidetes bacterium]|nr:MAG: DUF4271 domain-containing protein [Bacteroidota bacterium]
MTLIATWPDIIESFLSPLAGGLEWIPGASEVRVPDELSQRASSTWWIAIGGLTISFVLIAMSDMGPNRILRVFSRVLVKNASVERIVDEEYNLKSMSSLLLLLNFVISASTLIYLSQFAIFGSERNTVDLYYFLPLIPLYIFVWPLFWLVFVGWVSGEGKQLSENRKNVILLSQIFGILFTLLVLIWTFNPQWTHYFFLSFVLLMAFMWLFRVWRGVLFSFQHRIPWYYIVLYLMTLEILPLCCVYIFLPDIWN